MKRGDHASYIYLRVELQLISSKIVDAMRCVKRFINVTLRNDNDHSALDRCSPGCVLGIKYKWL